MNRLCSAILPLCALVLAAQAPEKPPPNSDSFKDFERRVADYVKLHKSMQAKLQRLKPTKSSEAIENHQRSLAHAIREARRGVRQGNIFTPEIAGQFRLLVAETMRGPESVRIRESLKHAEPARPQPLRANASYPAGLPLQSTPPSLLSDLPPLPPELAYRVIGHSLILHDIEANLIVDFISTTIL